MDSSGGEPEKTDYLLIYPDLISGYSEINVEEKKRLDGGDRILFEPPTFYFKHATKIDSLKISEFYKKEVEAAKKSGILPEKELIESAIEKGWWSQERERNVFVKSEYIARLKETKGKLLLKSQKEELQKEIDKEESELNAEKNERSSLIVDSAETFASKRLDEFYLLNLTFLDSNLSSRAFSVEDLDYLDDFTFHFLSSMVFMKISEFSFKKIRLLSASHFFQEIIRCCPEDDSQCFYGKSASILSSFQVDLFTFGNYYRKCIKHSSEKVPSDVLADPEKLIEWFENDSASSRVKKNLDRNPNAKKSKGERTGRMTSIVGATSEDYKNLGLQSDSKKTGKKDLLDLAVEGGGTADMGKLVASL